MALPDAIGHDAGGEGIFGGSDGVGEFEAAAAVFEGLAGGAGDNFEELARHFVAEAGGIAANENARVAFGGAVFDDEGVGWGGLVADEPAFDFALEFPDFFADGGGEKLVVGDDASVGDGGGRGGIVEEGFEFFNAGIFDFVFVDGFEKFSVAFGGFAQVFWSGFEFGAD
jgi:hypothetical protein